MSDFGYEPNDTPRSERRHNMRLVYTWAEESAKALEHLLQDQPLTDDPASGYMHHCVGGAIERLTAIKLVAIGYLS